jgi:hypothetical protein
MKICNLVLLVAAFSLSSVAMAEELTGTVKLIQEQKCFKCHIHGTQVTKPEEETKSPIDLTKLSADMMGQKDPAGFLQKYLMKKEKHPKKGGKDHKKKFAGTPEQLKEITEYVVKASTPEKK